MGVLLTTNYYLKYNIQYSIIIYEFRRKKGIMICDDRFVISSSMCPMYVCMYVCIWFPDLKDATYVSMSANAKKAICLTDICCYIIKYYEWHIQYGKMTQYLMSCFYST